MTFFYAHSDRSRRSQDKEFRHRVQQHDKVTGKQRHWRSFLFLTKKQPTGDFDSSSIRLGDADGPVTRAAPPLAAGRLTCVASPCSAVSAVTCAPTRWRCSSRWRRTVRRSVRVVPSSSRVVPSWVRVASWAEASADSCSVRSQRSSRASLNRSITCGGAGGGASCYTVLIDILFCASSYHTKHF